MTLTPAQKSAIEEILGTVIATTGPRGKRQISAMFMDLVDRKAWPHYYEVVPEPRCLNNIRDGISKNRYKDARDVYTDISLVFWNGLYYNEPGSQIASDAQTLKVCKDRLGICRTQVQLLSRCSKLNGRRNPFCLPVVHLPLLHHHKKCISLQRRNRNQWNLRKLETQKAQTHSDKLHLTWMSIF